MKKLILALISLGGTVVLGYFAFRFYKQPVPFIVFVSITAIFLICTVILVMKHLNTKNIEKISWLENRLNAWNSISHHVSAAGDEAFTKLPIGIVVYDSNLEVKWANEYSKKAFKSNLINNSIDVISDNFSEDILAGKEQMIISVFEEKYDVLHNVENHVLYFFNVTKREEIIKRYDDRIQTIAIISIDNLEESLRKYDVQEQSTLRGQILGVISEWASTNGCLLETLSSDEMLVVFDKESLNKMIEDKFNVLNEVRELSIKNHLKSTMSMGVACYDVEADELVELAKNALELAHKRGGDQVVVNIQNEKVKFFGGNTNAVEKNTLVEARIQTMALKEAIEESTNNLVMCDELADCDALGSMLGIWQLAYSTNKNAKMVFDPKLADITVQKIYEKILTHENDDIKNSFVTYNEAIDLIKPTTLLIVTDTQSPNRAMFPELLNRVQNVSVIDHHRAGEVGYKETLSYYVETSASSTVELVTEMFLFYNANVKSDKLIASIMLAGIVVDTNNFTYRTRTRTFEAASTLNTMGADMVLVRKLLRDSYEEERRIASAMVNAEIFEKRFAIIAQDENDIVPDRTTLAKISDKLLTIDGIETAFAIGRLPDGLVAISARSMDAVNVQIIMEELQGGGHFNAAATQLKDTTIAEAKDMLIQILRRDFVETGDETMKVILIADVKGKGKKDDVLDVANGYGNFLINNKLAVLASDENLKNLKAQQEQERINNENRRNVLEKVKSEIQDKFISVYLKVGADGKNFGHITSKYVCEEFEAQTGIHLDKKKVEIPVINSVGIFTASVKLDKDIVATFEVNVIEK